jgi:hypothetical protein
MHRVLIQSDNWDKFLLFEVSSLVSCMRIFSHNACLDVDSESIKFLIHLDRHDTIYIFAPMNLAFSNTVCHFVQQQIKFKLKKSKAQAIFKLCF